MHYVAFLINKLIRYNTERTYSRNVTLFYITSSHRILITRETLEPITFEKLKHQI